MLMHTLKLIWNRRRAHGLIIVELSLAFLIIFVLGTLGSHLLHRWNQPLGFEYENTWEVLVEPGAQWTEQDGAQLKSLLAVLRDQPEVEWAHATYPPFRAWTWSTSVAYGGREVGVQINTMTDGAPEAFDVELLEGRFFDETDVSDASVPVMIDAELASELFPHGFEPGADIRDRGSSLEPSPAWSVVGVFRAFRQQGELSPIVPYVISRFPIEDPLKSTPTIQVRLRPGTPGSFEESLQTIVQREAPAWAVTITPLSTLREQKIKSVTLPLTVAAWVAAFLLMMVAFGLFGVLWQSVTRRTDELGLRRALGAHRQRVYRLIVAETLLIAVFACLLGTLLAIQFPIASGFKALDWRSSISGLGIGFGTLLGLAALCSLYPAWLASRQSPAEALHCD